MPGHAMATAGPGRGPRPVPGAQVRAASPGPTRSGPRAVPQDVRRPVLRGDGAAARRARRPGVGGAACAGPDAVNARRGCGHGRPPCFTRAGKRRAYRRRRGSGCGVGIPAPRFGSRRDTPGGRPRSAWRASSRPSRRAASSLASRRAADRSIPEPVAGINRTASDTEGVPTAHSGVNASVST
jgi:hypothetical protein